MRGRLAALGAGLWLGIACHPALAQQPGQGVQAGRATAADVNSLNASIASFIQAERYFNFHTWEALVSELGLERQRQMMGITQDPDPDRPSWGSADLMIEVRQWWVDHVLQPALDIAANPAASCALAQSMLRRVMNVERQNQIMVGDAEFGGFGDSDAVMGRAWNIAKRRCLEEAFDECRNTGNGQALIIALTEWGRQIGIIAGENQSAWEEQVVYLFRRCTVYRLGYHMDLRYSGVFPTSYTADGSFTFLFQPAETGESIARMAQGFWRAPRPQDRPDITMSQPVCGNRAARCDLLPPVWSGTAWGIVQLQRDVTEQTVEIFRSGKEAREATPSGGSQTTITDQFVTNPSLAERYGGVVVLRTIRHREGHNRLTLNFGPPLVGYHVSLDYGAGGRFEDEEDPADNGTSLYYVATGSVPGEAPLLIDDDTWVQGTYPELYRTAHTASASRATETTTFSFTHRPDLFPVDEIRPELELVRRPPEPHRIPAQARF